MPGPQPPTITLTEAERHGLQALIQRHSTPQQIALRARIVLGAASGQNHAQVAQRLNTSIDTARLWRRRWLALQPIALEDLSVGERLEDRARPGTPPRLTADQICQIERLACEKPEQSERPISQWTGREIAAELMKRGIVDSISPRHVSRLLKRGASSHT
ncbi:MAG: helix-turn-helix domain-containing protein [Anaerolineales bacterium]|nr:helix-turn-helix domain-containing protein [Anaerolineales bacterium]